MEGELRGMVGKILETECPQDVAVEGTPSLSGLAEQLRVVAASLEGMHQEQSAMLQENTRLRRELTEPRPQVGVVICEESSVQREEVWSPDEDDVPPDRDPAANELRRVHIGIDADGDEPDADDTGKDIKHFGLRRLWQEDAETPRMQSRRLSISRVDIADLNLKQRGSWSMSSIEQSLQVTADGMWRYLIASPGSYIRTAWDMVGGILIFYDLIGIPLGFFDLPENTFTTVMDWITLIYWTLGIFNSLTTGFVHKGVTVMDPYKILTRYLRTWFWLDLVVLVPDWLFSVVISNESFDGNSVKLLRVARLTRTVRLLRILKLKQFLEALDDMLDSEVSTIAAQITKMLLLLLVINHYIACLWYLISWLASDSHPHNTWVKRYSPEAAPWWRLYLIAYHWSITQFTPASVDVQPENAAERAFAITVVVFALVGFSYVVGSITGSLTQLRSLSEKDAKQFWLLRRFLRHKHISFELTLRVRSFLDVEVGKRRNTVQIEEVEILKFLSNQMMAELYFEMYSPVLSLHPLILYMKEESPVMLQKICHNSITLMNAAKMDVVFHTESPATCMYFVSSGRFLYNHHADPAYHNDVINPKESWISEPVIWATDWIHVGNLVAKEVSVLLCIDGAKVEETSRLFPNEMTTMRGYAQRFTAWLNALNSELLHDIMPGSHALAHFQSFLPVARTSSKEKTPFGLFKKMSIMGED